jgi:hypothetical protein
VGTILPVLDQDSGFWGLRIRIKVLDDKNSKKFTAEKIIKLKYDKHPFFLFVSLNEGLLSYRRSLQPPKRTSSISKHEIYIKKISSGNHIQIRNPDPYLRH